MDEGGNSATLPYIGSKISLISDAEIRYEGILFSINTFESTVALQNVRSFGTEGRRQPEVPAQKRTYQFVVFKGKEIKDLTVCEPPGQMPDDPAIVNVNVPPSNTSMMGQPPPQSPPYRQMGQADTSGYDNRYGMPNRMGGYNQHVRHATPGYPEQGNRPMYYGGGRGVDMYQPGGVARPQYGRPDGEMDPSMMGGRGKYPIMRGGGGGGRSQTRRVVGELPAQPNQATKKEVSKAFDFEGANAKFDKTEAAKTDASPTAATTDAAASELKTATDTTATKPITTAAQRTGYDKTSSFFDTISCETLDRQAGQDARVDRDKQRQLDCETFGPTAAAPRQPRYPRPFRRGGGRGKRGGFGGYRPGGGRGYMPMDFGGVYGRY